jgi:hypothetical protein
MGNPPGLEKLDTTMKIGFIVAQQAALCQENFLTIYFFGFYYIIEKRVLAASSQDWQLTPFNRSLRKHASGVYLEADYGTLNPIV